jgi:hypothetical protein
MGDFPVYKIDIIDVDGTPECGAESIFQQFTA